MYALHALLLVVAWHVLLGQVDMCNKVVSEFQTLHQKQGYQDHHALSLFHWLLLLSLALIDIMHCRLHRVVTTFWLSVLLCFHTIVLALPRSHHNFLPFWCCDNETASAAKALWAINLHKCTQIESLIGFLTRTEVGATPHHLRTCTAKLVALH